MARLERDGIINRSRGKGTHVLRDLSRDRWLVMPSTWDELVSHSSALSARVDERRSGLVTLAPGAVRGRVAADPAGRLIYLADVMYPARSMRLDSRLI